MSRAFPLRRSGMAVVGRLAVSNSGWGMDSTDISDRKDSSSEGYINLEIRSSM